MSRRLMPSRRRTGGEGERRNQASEISSLIPDSESCPASLQGEPLHFDAAVLRRVAAGGSSQPRPTASSRFGVDLVLLA